MDYKKEIFKKMKPALGNTGVSLTERASDFMNRFSEDDLPDIAKEVCLCVSTLKRVRECASGYTASTRTIQNIYDYCGQEVFFRHVTIKTENSQIKPREY